MNTKQKNNAGIVLPDPTEINKLAPIGCVYVNSDEEYEATKSLVGKPPVQVTEQHENIEDKAA